MLKWIRPICLRCVKKLRQIIYQDSTTFSLIALLCLGLGIGLAGTYKLSMNLVDQQAQIHAQMMIQNLEATQRMYSQRIIQPLASIEGVTIHPEYRDINGGIPIPLTYMIELSQYLSEQSEGSTFSIYSDYPFPNRVNGGPQDNFQTEALRYLRQNPTDILNRKERLNHRMVFRYAKAIRMEASCVDCHNSLPNSPKKDWTVGDVRGVIEVTQPLDSILSLLKDSLQQLYLVLLVVASLAATGLVLTIKRFRSIKHELEKQVAQRTIELHRLATLDGLTQLANRRQFDQVITTEWNRLMRQQQPLSLLLCDVDYFKNYNDTYGHQMGDSCLIRIGQVMKAVVQRSGDLVARYGGEEFVIVLPNSESGDAMQMAERVRQLLQDQCIPHTTSQVASHVTLSIGIATLIPQRSHRYAQLIKYADQALYQAKINGRNQSVIWTASEKSMKRAPDLSDELDF